MRTTGRQNETAVSEPPGNLLLRAPSLSDGSREVCPTLCDHEERNLLLVSLSGNPDARLEAWKRHGGLPRKVAIVSVDEMRGAAVANGGSTSMRGPDGTAISTTTVSEASDLTGIGIKINKCLSAWEDEDVPTEVCFDSVTTLLQYVDVQRVFRFLHVITRRIDSIGGLAHYHIDPGAHDEQTLATIESAFSESFEYDAESASWSTD